MTTLTNIAAEHKRNVAPAELQSQIARGERPQLVDVREHPEFAAGRIAGARLLPLGELERRAAGLDRTRPVVCLCRSGKRSAQAAERLVALGFPHVQQLEGGLVAWEQAGLPVEKDAHAPWALERQVRFAAGLLMLAGLGLGLIWPVAVALSWFVGVGLVFAAVTDWCGMGLLLAKMPWNRPGQNCEGTCKA
jgi:rhodanese-related sulfurtransferase